MPSTFLTVLSEIVQFTLLTLEDLLLISIMDLYLRMEWIELLNWLCDKLNFYVSSC